MISKTVNIPDEVVNKIGAANILPVIKNAISAKLDFIMTQEIQSQLDTIVNQKDVNIQSYVDQITVS